MLSAEIVLFVYDISRHAIVSRVQDFILQLIVIPAPFAFKIVIKTAKFTTCLLQLGPDDCRILDIKLSAPKSLVGNIRVVFEQFPALRLGPKHANCSQ